MALKDLYKTSIMQQHRQQSEENTKEFVELKNQIMLPHPAKTVNGKPRRQHKLFYYSWDSINKELDHEKRRLQNNRLGACCFVDLIGRPQKNNRDWPMLPYQRLLWQMLHRHRRLWIKKSRGIGLSTFLLYVIAYKCLTEFQPGDRVIIITGIRIETVADLLRRFKLLFQRNFPGVYSELIKQKDTVCILNNVIVEGYPAGHTDSVRGADRVKMVWVDEADWFKPAESKAVRSAVEAFISKPNSENMYLILSSTVNHPNGLFAEIEKEDPSIYYKMILPYQFGLEGSHPIYDLTQLEKARMLPNFSREYECKYSWGYNGVFNQQSIDRAVELGSKYPVTINPAGQRVLGIDPGFSSSACGFCVLEYSDDIIKVVYAEQFEKPTFNDMIAKTFELYTTMKPDNILIDGANPEFIEAVKSEIGEDSDWHRIHQKLLQYKDNNFKLMEVMKVIPVSFAQYGATMMVRCKQLLEFEDPIIAIHPSFEKLITALRGATAQEYKYDKDSPYSDIFDAWRLAMKFFKLRK